MQMAYDGQESVRENVPLEEVSFGEAKWCPATRRLVVRGQPVKLAWRVAECLGLLVEAGGEVAGKDELQQRIWGGAMVEDSNLAKCITALRKVLDPAPDGGSYIETVARVGYRLTVPVVREETARASNGRRVPRWAYAMVVAGLVVAGLAVQRVAADYGHRQQAQALCDQGLALLRIGNRVDGFKAGPLFKQALDLVPDYPPAHAGLAEGAARYGREYFGGAIELADKAVRDDPGCGECQAILGYILMTREWKWKEAGDHLAKSVQQDPDRFMRRIWYANWLATQNRLPEAAEQARAGMRLEASQAQAHSLLCAIHFFSGAHRDATRECETAIAINPRHQPGYYWLERAKMVQGEEVNAVLAHAEEVAVWQQWSAERTAEYNEGFQRELSKGGRRGVVNAWLQEAAEGKPRDLQRYYRATWFAWLGDDAQALEELEAAVETRPYHLIYTAVDPSFVKLRGQPRFEAVLKKVGLRQ